jgi:hypothetical protein
MASASKSIPFVARLQVVPTPETITQNELSMLLSLRGRLHQLAAQVEAAEQSVKERLEHGATVEEGDHLAELKESYRASVAWKDKAIDLADRLGLSGEVWAKNVLTHTAKNRIVSLVLQ